MLLFGGWFTNPFEKYATVKLDHFPKDRGEHQKYLNWGHHLAGEWAYMSMEESIIYWQDTWYNHPGPTKIDRMFF